VREFVYVGVGALVTGALAVLWVGGGISRRRERAAALADGQDASVQQPEATSKVKCLRRASLFALLATMTALPLAIPSPLKAQETAKVPSVPATMATDQPQRMRDGSLFVPKATQHLLSVRTVLGLDLRSPAACHCARYGTGASRQPVFNGHRSPRVSHGAPLTSL